MTNLPKICGPRWLSSALLLCLIPTGRAAQTVTLQWDGSTSNVAGYRLYYGTSSGVYTQHLDVGKTFVTLSNLTAGRTYFFSVTAYTSVAESSRSNEVSYRVPVSNLAAEPTPVVMAQPPPSMVSKPVAKPTIQPAVPVTSNSPITSPAPVPVVSNSRKRPRKRFHEVHDMQAHPLRHGGSVEAAAYAEWCQQPR
jgi:hypothetical protein